MVPNVSGMGVRKNFKLLKYEHIIGGPRATTAHQKYSCILETFYKLSLFFKSAFLVSICYVIKHVIKPLLSKLINEPEVDFVM